MNEINDNWKWYQVYMLYAFSASIRTLISFRHFLCIWTTNWTVHLLVRKMNQNDLLICWCEGGRVQVMNKTCGMSLKFHSKSPYFYSFGLLEILFLILRAYFIEEVSSAQKDLSHEPRKWTELQKNYSFKEFRGKSPRGANSGFNRCGRHLCVEKKFWKFTH